MDKLQEVKLTWGDFSADGHEKTGDSYFLTNKTTKEIEDAFLASESLTGLTWGNAGWNNESGNFFTNSILSGYEEDTLHKDVIEKLKYHGIDALSLLKDPEDGFYVDEANELLVQFIKLTLPDLVMIPFSKKEQTLNFGNPYRYNIGYAIFR